MQPRHLIVLGQWLRNSGYNFTTITPTSHARVLARGNAGELSNEDILGWNRYFHEYQAPAGLMQRLADAGVLQPEPKLGPDCYKSTVRFSTLDRDIYCHSGFPTQASDSVFFGPDTYRFASLIQRSLADACQTGCRIVDIGCGSGAGGIVAVRQLQARWIERHNISLTLGDINQTALDFATVNAALADVEAKVRYSDVLAGVEGLADVILANPPYLIDSEARTYRHGGGDYGMGLAERILKESVARLDVGGKLILYTGTAIVEREDLFLSFVRRTLGNNVHWHYEQIDPDVFGEELDTEAYRDVDRIAAVGLTVRRLS